MAAPTSTASSDEHPPTLSSPPPLLTTSPPSPIPRASPSLASSLSSSLSSSFLGLYVGLGVILLGSGCVLGFQMGSRQAAKLEHDYPADTSKKHRLPPPITPAQRVQASRQALGALGLGTVLCCAFGYGLTRVISYRMDVRDTREFAHKMPTVVQGSTQRWLGALVSRTLHPLLLLSVMRRSDILPI